MEAVALDAVGHHNIEIVGAGQRVHPNSVEYQGIRGVLDDQDNLVAGVAQPWCERSVEGADPAAGEGVQVTVNQRNTHPGSPSGVQALAEGVPLRSEQGQPALTELANGQFGVQAQLAG